MNPRLRAPVTLHPIGLTPEEIGLLLAAGGLPQCQATKDINGRRWVCRTTVHDTLPGVGYGRAESHRWVPAR